MDDGQGRLDKATFELARTGRRPRRGSTMKPLSELVATAELGMPLLGDQRCRRDRPPSSRSCSRMSSPPTIGWCSALIPTDFLVGSISFNLSRLLGESLTARLVALPRQEPTSAAAAALTPTREPTLTPTPDPTPTSTPAPTSTPTPTPEPTPTPIPRTWTCPSGTVYDDSTRSCIRVSAERVSNREPSQTGSSPTGEYVVQAGDTLRSIAERFGTTINSLIEANGIDDPNLIRAGLILQIPVPRTGAVDASTISSIASPTPTPLPTPSPTPVPTPTTRPTPTPRPAPSVVTVRQLVDAWENNSIAADRKYKGRTTNIEGYLESIDTVFGTVIVSLSDGSEFSLWTVNCDMKDGQEDELAKLNKGDRIIVRGRITGEWFLSIGAEACVLLGVYR